MSAAPSKDEAAAIVVALAAVRASVQPARAAVPAWRLAGRMPWLCADELRARTKAGARP